MQKRKLQLNQAINLKERILLKIDKLYSDLPKQLGKSSYSDKITNQIKSLQVAYDHLNLTKQIIERANAGTWLDRLFRRETNHLRIYRISDIKRIMDSLIKLSNKVKIRLK